MFGGRLERHITKTRYSALLRLKSTGLFRRFDRDAIRGTKTVLAVLAMLASVLAWGSAPVRADDNDGDLGRHKVRVLTQNMFLESHMRLGPILHRPLLFYTICSTVYRSRA
jgi:hypothetical protein